MNLPIVELNNQRILTTEQLAEFYGTTVDRIKQSFNRNKEKFIEGKHYYRLEGQDLKEFKDRVSNSDLVGKNANSLILYTKQGAGRHSKIINTNRAWDMFDELEENYFNPRINVNKLSYREQAQLALAANEETNQRVDVIESKISELSETMRISGQQEFEIKQTASVAIIKILGGKDSKAYEKLSRKVFSNFWSEFKKYFKVPRYGELPRKRFDEALRYISFWAPDTELRILIATENAQTKLFDDIA